MELIWYFVRLWADVALAHQSHVSETCVLVWFCSCLIMSWWNFFGVLLLPALMFSRFHFFFFIRESFVKPDGVFIEPCSCVCSILLKFSAHRTVASWPWCPLGVACSLLSASKTSSSAFSFGHSSQKQTVTRMGDFCPQCLIKALMCVCSLQNTPNIYKETQWAWI